MNRGMILMLAFVSVGCGTPEGSTYFPNYVAPEAGEAAPPQLVCAQNFCGTIVDKNTGATADCGTCSGYTECGDNGVANVCGSACLPVVADNGDGGSYTVTPACDQFFGTKIWWAEIGATGGEQFPVQCSYADPNNCEEINIATTQNTPCSDTVCGTWWCCLYQPGAGFNPLLPGAVANNDGGLP